LARVATLIVAFALDFLAPLACLDLGLDLDLLELEGVSKVIY